MDPKHRVRLSVESCAFRRVGPSLLACALLASMRAAQDVGHQGPSFSGAGATPTESKPENKLWFNDGHWWGSLWSTSAQAFRIHRLDFATQRWIDTGVEIEARPDSHGDALWDGTKLYIASHQFATMAEPGHPILILRYSYDPGSDTYSRDTGFPVTIGNSSTEALVIDKDSTGTVWAAWTQGRRVWISHTQGTDTSWKPAFVLPANTTDLLDDDLCALIHFNGDRIGVVWSDQFSTSVRFSFHLDGAADTSWSAAEDVTGSADDHINLAADSAGRVYLVAKTGLDEVLLLVRDAAGWHRYLAWQPSPIHTRPVVLLDEQARRIHLFTTAQHTGEVFEKVSSMDAIAFGAGEGTLVMRDGDAVFRISDPTSTKQNIDSTSGLVVLAHHDTTGFYWHHAVPPGGGGAPAADFGAAPRSGQAPLTVSFTDASTGEITSRQWSFGDGATSSALNPVHTYSAGTYSVSLTVSGPGGSDTETKAGFIVVSGSGGGVPVADFTASTRSGPAPLTVSFSDASSGSIDSWSWNFGDGGTSGARNPTHQYASPGSYTVSLTVTGSGGSDTETKTGFISVSRPPSNLSLARPIPGLAGVPNVLTVTGATPGSSVSFYASRTQGSGTASVSSCPSGVPLGLLGPTRLGSATATPLGVAVFTFFVPITDAGKTFHYQAVDGSTCSASNVVTESY